MTTRYEICFFGLTSASTMKCVGGIKLFSRVYSIRKIKKMIYLSIFAFYQSNVLYLHSTESKYGTELLQAINPSKQLKYLENCDHSVYGIINIFKNIEY